MLKSQFFIPKSQFFIPKRIVVDLRVSAGGNHALEPHERIVKGQSLVKPGVPESFRVLVKELQGLGLDVDVTFDDGSHGDIPLEDDDKPVFNSKQSSKFSSESSQSTFKRVRRPRKQRANLDTILSEEQPKPEENEQAREAAAAAAADIFEKTEPTVEDLEKISEEEKEAGIGEEEI